MVGVLKEANQRTREAIAEDGVVFTSRLVGKEEDQYQWFRFENKKKKGQGCCPFFAVRTV